MGFPVAYSELLLPRLLLHTLSLLAYLRKFISTLFLYLGLPDFLEPDIPWREYAPETHHASAAPVSALLIRELLPVVKFSDLVDPPESCAVCLYDFEGQDEIRRLTNCRHIFHRSCLDRWMGYDQKTCPLCRTSFVPDDMQQTFNERLWAASGIPEVFGDYSQITAL
ncbi:hypothetical protein Goshw_010773 [Gossypium schwendimanii]|uniref:RING-type domain-containing protein n=6 Tax=Gossypium TaxID=3633 RepID=A0A9D3W1D4_9ROSI|nr:hypothetical protein ES319_D08G145300v1 [Gossypium barbadense]KAH1107199.1 hypothetical protein J1N35_010967 [Gossypium stocksii]MBA0852875.1 hypothetical protein [Gossypium schwendimanii]TYG57579.1 hypothetical protein ES288_D08G154200v1 [Gossypium darwinii]TYH58393.1 hypothetical protein ES332_D08G150100v1 [Gossypium tomentosum]